MRLDQVDEIIWSDHWPCKNWTLILLQGGPRTDGYTWRYFTPLNLKWPYKWVSLGILQPFKWNSPDSYNWVLGPPCTNLQKLEIQAHCHCNVKERSIRPGFVQMNLALFCRNQRYVLRAIGCYMSMKAWRKCVHSGFLFPKEIIKENSKNISLLWRSQHSHSHHGLPRDLSPGPSSP